MNYGQKMSVTLYDGPKTYFHNNLFVTTVIVITKFLSNFSRLRQCRHNTLIWMRARKRVPAVTTSASASCPSTSSTSRPRQTNPSRLSGWTWTRDAVPWKSWKAISRRRISDAGRQTSARILTLTLPVTTKVRSLTWRKLRKLSGSKETLKMCPIFSVSRTRAFVKRIFATEPLLRSLRMFLPCWQLLFFQLPLKSSFPCCKSSLFCSIQLLMSVLNHLSIMSSVVIFIC